MKIYLVRHTSVDVPQGMCYGQTDVSLKNTFEEEAQVVKNKINQIQADAVFSSPLSRCTRLANFCNYDRAHLDMRLKELNFGDWEGQQWDDIDMSVWKQDWINPPAPNGESFMEMYCRVASFLDDLKTKSFKSVIIFAHGGVISCAKVYFGRCDIEQTFEQMPQYGEIVEFEFEI